MQLLSLSHFRRGEARLAGRRVTATRQHNNVAMKVMPPVRHVIGGGMLSTQAPLGGLLASVERRE
ncbi:hypothetical protein AERO9AM_20751 [Aeromicrobium sp. 9AM]|nr:hypothetical protein AERO9AM_20751 [Aeromicrobium sp. 9AM]